MSKPPLDSHQKEIKRLRKTISVLKRRLEPLIKYEPIEASRRQHRVTCSNWSEFDEGPSEDGVTLGDSGAE